MLVNLCVSYLTLLWALFLLGPVAAVEGVEEQSRRRQAQPSKALFPVGFKYGWTTSSFTFAGVQNVPLSDDALRVERVSSGTTHNIVQINQKTAWEAVYPKGSRNPSSSIRGGFGFYLSGPAGWNITKAKEVTFSYAVMFENDFQWQKGGKLPGLFGGIGESAYACSGGRQEDRDKCFDLRYMWRKSGDGELYAYLPQDHPNTDYTLLSVPPYSARNSDYGFSIGRGSWRFKAGEWNTMSEHIKLNTPGAEDGAIQVFWNGNLVISAKDIAIRDYAASSFKGVHAQTFFGGSDDSWNSPKDQRAYFADISGAFIN